MASRAKPDEHSKAEAEVDRLTVVISYSLAQATSADQLELALTSPVGRRQ